MTPPGRDKNTFQLFWEDRTVAKHFRSGVSLHSHTMHSEESLDFLPRHVGKIPILSRVLPSHIDYQQGFWTPPLSPLQAYRLEDRQVQSHLQLPALVSLTDHDNIRASTMLRVMEAYRDAPISVEWTVPFGQTFFHIGVHNLPPSRAGGIMEELKSFTHSPGTQCLRNKLSILHSQRDVLLVLNHPLWDEKGIGSEAHTQELGRLLTLIHPYLHALELNGLRSWTENSRVIRLANESGKPVVSGGDRHGCEPNAILNLSSAASFAEFVQEVRQHRKSHVVFMPQYRQSLQWRTTQTVMDVLRNYPRSFAGRRVWTERVFYRSPGGTAESMARLFPEDRLPSVFKTVSAAVNLVQLRGVRSVVRMLMSNGRADRRSLNNLISSCGLLEMEREFSA